MERDGQDKNVETVGTSGEPKAEFFTLAGIAAALGLGASGVEKLRLAIQSADPLVVQVLNSAGRDQYKVDLKASNQTVHGIYLEELELVQPKKRPLQIRLSDRSFSFEEPKPETFPVLVEPGQSIKFSVTFELTPADQNMSYGEMQLTYMRLDQKDDPLLSIRFRIRRT